MTIFYFTSTGNSIQVARSFSGELVSIPAVLKGAKRYWKDDVIGIVTPTYFGAPPKPVMEFIKDVKLESEYLFYVLTCGNTPARAYDIILDLASEVGLRFDYINSIKMVDNYFPYFNVKSQVETLPSKHVDENLNRIIQDVKCRRQFIAKSDWYGKIAGWYMSIFPLSPKAYKNFYLIEEKCDHCRICEKVCPLGNIVMSESLTPIIRSKCLTCGACYHNCPSGAIHYKGEKSDYRYRNADVSLTDIIKANDSVV